MVKKRKVDSGDFVMNRCPEDCPFRDKMSFGITFCSFAIYANLLEPERLTRTEIRKDGTVDYHIPPDCDVYKKYKDRAEEIKALKKKYDQYGVKRLKHKEPDLYVTGPMRIVSHRLRVGKRHFQR